MPRKRAEGTRAPNNASTIYEGTDGYWHGRVSMGLKDDGKPDRRHVSRKTETEVIDAVRALENERDSGKIRKTGKKSWTVEKWLKHWLEEITAPPVITENAWDAYRVAVESHLIPGIGAHRLDRLEPEHLEKLYRKMLKAGAAPGRVHQVHRTIRTALGVAWKRDRIVGQNPAALAKAPKLSESEVEPYEVEEIQQLLEAAVKKRNSARWAIALALGLRQGEVIGLRWSDIDLTEGILRVRRNALRPKWAHGCDTRPCGRKYGGYCPDRVNTRPETADTKSRAGKRVIALPDQLIAMLKKHRTDQEIERTAAAQIWQETGFVFTDPMGRRLNTRTDWEGWKRLLREAGIRDSRLHDARHTAATVLLLLGVPERTVMSIMGWSSTAMAARYQHVTSRIRRTVADQLGVFLWAEPKAKKGKGKKRKKSKGEADKISAPDGASDAA